MKKTLLAIACGLVMALTAATAQAAPLTTADNTFLGTADPGSPASPAFEIYFINFLLDMPLNSTDSDDPPPSPPNTVYNFVRSGNACAGCADATATGAVQVDTGGPVTLDVSNYTYLLAKYGNVAYVWYVANLTSVTVTSNLSGVQNGLSHYALFNPGTVRTPDGGTTLGLLGLGLMGVGYLRRRLS
jgi:VPDSG-CTERM motif